MGNVIRFEIVSNHVTITFLFTYKQSPRLTAPPFPCYLTFINVRFQSENHVILWLIAKFSNYFQHNYKGGTSAYEQ